MWDECLVQAQQPAQQVGPGVQLTGRRTKANKQLLLQLLETFRSFKPGQKALTHIVLSNLETPSLIQKRHPCTGNLTSETSGDRKTALLHCGDVLGHVDKTQSSCGCRSVVCLCALPLPHTRGEREAVIGHLFQPPLTCPLNWQLIGSLFIPDYCCPTALSLTSIKWPFCSFSAHVCFQ